MKMKKLTLKQFVEYLKGFKSEKALVAALKRRKIKGLPGEPYACPLAVLGKRLCGERVGIASDINFEWTPWYARLPTPKIANSFATRFDSGAYPELAKRKPKAV
jgi:hypothetical protein